MIIIMLCLPLMASFFTSPPDEQLSYESFNFTFKHFKAQESVGEPIIAHPGKDAATPE